MSDYHVGKTKITVKAEGCTQCGTMHSSGWSTFKYVPVTVNRKEFILEIPICADCKQPAAQPSLEGFRFAYCCELTFKRTP